MGLETVSNIADLVITNPVGATDPKSEGDDHIRNIKKALKTDLPNITGPITASQAELNRTVGLTSSAVGLSDTQTLTNKEITSAVLTTGVSGTAVLDEDNMASDSSTQVATQQSIKAYVDNNIIVESDFTAITSGTTYIHEWSTISTASTTTSTTYTMVNSERIVIKRGGDYTVAFSMLVDASGTATARIYKNGAAFGTEQSTSNTAFVVKSEVLTFVTGDYVDLYAHGDGGAFASVKDIKLQSSTKLFG